MIKVGAFFVSVEDMNGMLLDVLGYIEVKWIDLRLLCKSHKIHFTLIREPEVTRLHVVTTEHTLFVCSVLAHRHWICILYCAGEEQVQSFMA